MSSTQRDVAIVGAGFSGMYLLHRLRGLGFSVQVYEAGPDVGGTWFWNRYPGARVDVQSITYSYSFDDALQQEWEWTERFAAQPELMRYINHVADRFDLRRDIQLGTRVTVAHFDEATNRWEIETDRGDHVSAPFCIMATGCLSVSRLPDIPGLESFAGDWYHTGAWPHDGVDFTGKTVGIIGTGSSAVQTITTIAGEVDHLTVFQRTPNFSVPAWNGPADRELEQQVKDNYPSYRQRARESFAGDIFNFSQTPALSVTAEEREAEFERRWGLGGFAFLVSFVDIVTDREANAAAAEFVHRKIREQVQDPAVADLLCPQDHPFGTKRLCVDTGYYKVYNRDNVTLVDVKSDPIAAITPNGLRLESGAGFEFDSLILATGFDAMTGALFAIDIRGRDGLLLSERWSAGPRSYLGLQVAGFPNMFTITGPGSPSVLSNMMVSIEQHVDWVTDCIVYVRDHGLTTIEAELDAEDRWVDHVNEVGAATLLPEANSWYMGANVPGKPRVFMPYVGGVGAYRIICDEVVAKGYEGFALKA